MGKKMLDVNNFGKECFDSEYVTLKTKVYINTVLPLIKVVSHRGANEQF